MREIRFTAPTIRLLAYQWKRLGNGLPTGRDILSSGRASRLTRPRVNGRFDTCHYYSRRLRARCDEGGSNDHELFTA